jgi:hypothetical protein
MEVLIKGAGAPGRNKHGCPIRPANAEGQQKSILFGKHQFY